MISDEMTNGIVPSDKGYESQAFRKCEIGFNKHESGVTDQAVLDGQCKQSDSPAIIANKSLQRRQKSNFLDKIWLRLSKPRLFSKEKRSRKDQKSKKPSSSSSTGQSLSPDNKRSNTVSEHIDQGSQRSKSFRSIFNRFGKVKTKRDGLSEPPSSMDSRPSVTSSAVNTTVNVDSAGSCVDGVYVDKLCKKDLEKYNSSSIDFIPADKIEGEEEGGGKSKDKDLMCNTEEDKLSPLNVNWNLTSVSADHDRSCRSSGYVCNNDNSSNVRLTLSLYGYTCYGLRTSRFTSKSCMDFRSSFISPKSKISMDNIALFSEKMNSLEWNDHLPGVRIASEGDAQPDKDDVVAEKVVDTVGNNIDAKSSEETNVVLRKCDRPTEIQLKRSRGGSQSSVTKSSLIMVTVSQNSPRTKTAGNHVSTPTYDPESPGYPGRKWDFEEDSKAIKEEKMEKVESERNGNDFLIIANKYETEIIFKIEVVQRYLEEHQAQMTDDVIGELQTAVGLAKLLINEKFVQFRGLCYQNINESANENEFKTLPCDLEGYLTTLEIQMVDLNRNFQLVEVIRANNWQMPLDQLINSCNNVKKKKMKPKVQKINAAEDQRSLESRRRIAEYRKMCVSNNQVVTNMLVIN